MSNLLFSDGQHRTGGSNCEMFEMTWQVLTLKAVLHHVSSLNCLRNFVKVCSINFEPPAESP